MLPYKGNQPKCQFLNKVLSRTETNQKTGNNKFYIFDCDWINCRKSCCNL